VKASISDFSGRLRIEVSPESAEERMLLRAFLREHEGCSMLFNDCVESKQQALTVTFGEAPFKPGGDR
jgi:hypothetical protein